MKYAIIGSGGFIAPRHFEAIKDIGGEVTLTCDIRPEVGADFTDYRDMLLSDKMKNIDAIVICTPNYLHPEMVRDCSRTNKIIICEKPISINTDFTGLEKANVVQQLHEHPLFNIICEKLKKAKKVKAIMRAYRDEEFWKSWKGDEQLSGGVVYILGSHIIDLLTTALGGEFKIIKADDTMRRSSGVLILGGVEIEYLFEFLDSRNGQTRHLEIDGEKYVLSLRDNLSFEGLHDKVHKSILEGNGIKIDKVKDSIYIMDKIKKIG